VREFMAKKPKKKWKKRLRRAFAALVLLCIVLGAVALFYLSREVLEYDLEFRFKNRSAIYDRHGELASYIYQENREYISLDAIPEDLINAVIAVEDKAFWTHYGINVKSIIRALIVDIKEGAKVQGASTITQQLVKNMFLTHDKTWTRKIKEAALAMLVETRYTKEELLEYYLNLIYLGPNVYGVEAASQYYFQKPVSELNLSECALLAGIIKSPGNYSPFLRLENAYKRRDLVLGVMADAGYITEEEKELALAQEISTTPGKRNDPPNYYIAEVMKELTNLGYSYEQLRTRGYKIYTALDLEAQRLAEKTIKELVPVGYVDQNELMQPQAAMVVLDVETGGIMVLVGGRGQDHFNRATMAKRQPGSTLKPFIYLAALQKGYNAATLVSDSPIEFDGWSPQNYDYNFLGDIALGYALERSRNLAAVRVLADVGVDRVIELTNKLGIRSITRQNDRNLALALGGLTEGVTPLEMAAGYAAFPRGGTYIEPFFVTEIVDEKGNTVYKRNTVPQRVMTEEEAFMILDMLRNVVEYGTGRSAKLSRPAAGKTGISDNYTNAWFVGFTPEIASAVWIGNDRQAEPMQYGSSVIGSSMAARVFKEFATEYLQHYPVKDWEMPESVARVSIDVYTGKQTESDEVLRRYYAFRKDDLPERDKVRFIDEITEKLQRFWQRLFGF
jgi:penicillin-binding protein 1A